MVLRTIAGKELSEPRALYDISTVEGSVRPGPREAALASLAYADLFSYPLSAEEACRYQIGTNYSLEEIESALRALSEAGKAVSGAQYFALLGRDSLFTERQAREQLSAIIWRRANYRATGIVRTPFVRMVAVTGALSMNNVSGRADIDLLILTEPGRVWIARRLLVLQVRLARFFGDDLCPNFILAADHLQLAQRDLFTAHELAQMVPVSGEKLYREMLARNEWARHFLPAAFGETHEHAGSSIPGAPSRFKERILGTRLFNAWESWELRRLRKKLGPVIGKAAEVVCSPEQCKGHTGLHRSSVLTRLGARLDELGLGEYFTDFLRPDRSAE